MLLDIKVSILSTRKELDTGRDTGKLKRSRF